MNTDELWRVICDIREWATQGCYNDAEEGSGPLLMVHQSQESYLGIADRIEAALDAQAGGWLPIESAPEKGVHVRGLWVTMKHSKLPDRQEWRQYIGLIEEDSGRFVDPEYCESYGWESSDFSHWMPLPAGPVEGGDNG